MSDKSEAWCVAFRDARDGKPIRGWCALASQPKDPLASPKFRDEVKTRCGAYIILPGPFKHRVPTCEDCLR